MAIPSSEAGVQTLTFTLAGPDNAVHPVVLAVYDVLGRHVRTLINRRLAGALHTVTWDGIGPSDRKLRPGVYCARLGTGSLTDSRVLVLLR